MNTLSHWLAAFRLRTLPLSFSSILVGSFIAFSQGKWNGTVMALALATTLFLQILSNLANDLGDTLKGTDNEKRLGPERSVQSGKITISQMKWAVGIFAGLSLISGVILLWVGFRGVATSTIVFFVLGILAIAAAMMYTLGKKPYGYMGLGDLFVFLFFGLLGVGGTYYLHTNTFDWDVLYPASAIGMLCAGVLNMNNIRDHENDEESGKRTLVVILGTKAAKVYHSLLILGAIGLLLYYTHEHAEGWINYLFLGAVPLLCVNLIKVWSVKSYKAFDGQLKLLAMSTFLLAVLFSVGWMV